MTSLTRRVRAALLRLQPDLSAQISTVGGQILASLQELKDELATIKAGVDASNTAAADLKAQIQALKDQLANAGVVSQADLDALDAQADAIIAAQGTASPSTGGGL